SKPSSKCSKATEASLPPTMPASHPATFAWTTVCCLPRNPPALATRGLDHTTVYPSLPPCHWPTGNMKVIIRHLPYHQLSIACRLKQKLRRRAKRVVKASARGLSTLMSTKDVGERESTELKVVMPLTHATDDVIYDILSWLDPIDVASAASVCHRWAMLSSGDILWRDIHLRCFGDTCMPDGATGGWKQAYKARLIDPLLGDSVQVAWNGKFRLDPLHVFCGSSWWQAKIVGKEPTLGYRVHYQCWNHHWDEWVQPSRIRWPLRSLNVWEPSQMLKQGSLEVGDLVEFWSSSDAVGGAWLQARVAKLTASAACLTDMVVTSECLWISRTRVRPLSDAPPTILRIAGRHQV
ncbi:unnamed protein product, partial [Chrysoparadoxa australica]